LRVESAVMTNAIKRADGQNVPVVLYAGEDGFIVAECPVIPGCISQGKTRDEALANIKEAIELCLESRGEEDDWGLPADYEIIDVPVIG
jgi:predicted RNase H-like HicB family nuclease